MPDDILPQLKQIFLFQNLEEDMLQDLCAHLRVRNLKPEEFLFKKNDPADSLFIINNGKLKIIAQDSQGTQLVLNQIGAGELVGEISLFDASPRTASVAAAEDSTVFELRRDDFFNLIRAKPDMALSILHSMSMRMRYNTEFIQKVTEWAKKIAEGDFSFAKQKESDEKSKEPPANANPAERAEFAFLKMVRELNKDHYKRVQAIEPDLRNFLPAEMYADLYISEWADRTQEHMSVEEIDKIDRKKLEPIFEHLAALQKVLSDYTSSLVSEKRDERVRLHTTKRSGALMFTDLAGFTRLMEANAARGQEGAKDLLKEFNRYFTNMIDVVVKSGGDLLEFTGDALLILFSAPVSSDEKTNFNNIKKAVAKAVRAGLRMQRKMEDHAKIQTPSGEIELKMRIGIHAGDFHSADIGTPRRRDHVLLGKNVQLAKLTESFGENGWVNLSPEAYQYVQDEFRYKANEKSADYHLVVDDFEENLSEYEIMAKTATRRLASAVLYEKSFDKIYDGIVALLNVIREFASFLPQPVLSLLVESVAKENGIRRAIRPEFPSPTVMFVNFIGLPEMIDKGIYKEESIVASFNETFAKLNAAVEKRGGVLKKVTYHLAGSDIVIYFGVPTAHTNDPLRAASAALDILKIITETKIPERKEGCQPDPELGDQPFKCKIGINMGPAFVAEIGDPRGRREYNVLGDTVNTTARLMSKAGDNEIYISQSVVDHIKDKYQCDFVGEIQLKGKGAPMPIYKLTGKK